MHSSCSAHDDRTSSCECARSAAGRHSYRWKEHDRDTIEVPLVRPHKIGVPRILTVTHFDLGGIELLHPKSHLFEIESAPADNVVGDFHTVPLSTLISSSWLIS